MVWLFEGRFSDHWKIISVTSTGIVSLQSTGEDKTSILTRINALLDSALDPSKSCYLVAWGCVQLNEEM